MSAAQLDIITASLLNDIQEAKHGGPNSLVVAGGDLDFRFPGDETFRIDGYGRSGSSLQDVQNRSAAFAGGIAATFRRLYDALLNMAEITDNRPTFFWPRDLTSYKLDRLFWSMPAWAFQYLDLSGGTIGFPDQMNRDRLSDHCPVTITARVIPQHCPEDRPIPSWVTKSPQFKTEIKKRIRKNPWLSKIDSATDCTFSTFQYDPRYTQPSQARG